MSASTRNRIAGYYTLAAGSVPLTDLSETMAKKVPRYPLVPVARIGRLAVSVAFQKKQLGAALLWDAGQRATQPGVGVFALVADAKMRRPLRSTSITASLHSAATR
jgi:hypothetical protein